MLTQDFQQDFGEFLAASTIRFLATLVDADELPLQASALTTCTLMVYDLGTGLTEQLPKTDVRSFVVAGVLDYALPPSASAILDPLHYKEPKAALLEWTYNAGQDANGFRALFTVVNDPKRV